MARKYTGDERCAACGSPVADNDADYTHFSVPLCDEKCQKKLHKEISRQLFEKHHKNDSDSGSEDSRGRKKKSKKERARTAVKAGVKVAPLVLLANDGDSGTVSM